MSNVTLAADTEKRIRAAFSSSSDDQAYIFFGKEYVLINYNKASIIRGPEPIHDGFLSLANTFFAETGIDCAFRARDIGDGNEAFIFCGSLCALWRFEPKSKKVEEILKGPMTIGQMFPFFKGTEFEKGIDAAFESSITYEAYLFKGKQYARINYNTGELSYITDITQGFGCLKKTIFEDGIIGADFPSLTDGNEVYQFKDNKFFRINDGKIIVGPTKTILPTWAALEGILPLNDQGPDTRPLPLKNQGPDPQATLDQL